MKAPPPCDLLLWDAIEDEVIALSENEIHEVAQLCWEEGFVDTPLRDEDGREYSPGVSIYDIIQLDSRWETWFARIDLPNGRAVLQEEIEKIAVQEGHAFAGRDYDWTEIDWPVIGRMIGATILSNFYEQNTILSRQDGELLSSANIWEVLDVAITDIGCNIMDPVPILVAHDALENLIQRGIDPLADISRASDGPAKPLTYEGSFVRINPDIERVRNHIRTRNQLRGGGAGEPRADILGILCLEVINHALERLSIGDISEFAFTMHGLAGYMAIRRDPNVQKIGMHLFSSILIRKEIRGVGGLLVCDIANSLTTRFSIGKALEVLRNNGIISWGRVNKSFVDTVLRD